MNSDRWHIEIHKPTHEEHAHFISVISPWHNRAHARILLTKNNVINVLLLLLRSERNSNSKWTWKNKEHSTKDRVYTIRGKTRIWHVCNRISERLFRHLYNGKQSQPFSSGLLSLRFLQHSCFRQVRKYVHLWDTQDTRTQFRHWLSDIQVGNGRGAADYIARLGFDWGLSTSRKCRLGETLH